MGLPKIEYVTFDVKDSITGQSFKMRPMLVKEEKILLIAKTSDNRLDRINAIKSIITNCIVDEPFDVDKLPFVTLEWLFLKLRSQSISNIIEVQYNVGEKRVEYKIDLDKVEIKQPKKQSKPTVIKINDSISLVMKLPTVATYSNHDFYQLDQQGQIDFILADSIDSVLEGDTAHKSSLANRDELAEFINSLPAKTYKKIQQFFAESPSLYYKFEIDQEDGTKQTIELTTLEDFFTFI